MLFIFIHQFQREVSTMEVSEEDPLQVILGRAIRDLKTYLQMLSESQGDEKLVRQLMDEGRYFMIVTSILICCIFRVKSVGVTGACCI